MWLVSDTAHDIEYIRICHEKSDPYIRGINVLHATFRMLIISLKNFKVFFKKTNGFKLKVNLAWKLTYDNHEKKKQYCAYKIVNVIQVIQII